MKNVFFIKTGKSVKEGCITPEGILEYSNDGDIIILNDSNIMSNFYSFSKLLKKNLQEGETRTFIPGLDMTIQDYGRVTLIPKSEEGLKLLYKLHEVSFKRNQDFPNINMEDLIAADKMNVLYIVSGGNNSLIYNMIETKNSELKKSIMSMKNFIVGISQNELFDEEDKIAISKKFARVAKKELVLQQQFICHTKAELVPLKRINDASDSKFLITGDFGYSLEEANDIFAKNAELATNSYNVFKDINVPVLDAHDYGYFLPKFKTPNNETSEAFFLDLIYKGLEKIGKSDDKAYLDRVDEEYEVISSMGFIDYFLIYWDVMRFCKESDIMTGPGRGSAAGALLAYLIGITKLDPVKLNLLFERFLNLSRISMPDIDADFQKARRQEVIQYIIDTYGEDTVSRVVTFGQYKSKNSIEDIVRTKGLPLEVAVKLKAALGDTNLVKYMAGKDEAPEVDELLALEKENFGVSTMKTQMNGQWEEVLFSYEDILEEANLLVKNGVTRQFGQHASAIIVGDRPLRDIAPMLTTGKNHDFTYALDGGDAEARGSLKLDILGLKTLDIIQETLRNTDMTEDVLDYKSSYETIDKEVLRILQAGLMTDIFQFESAGMRSWIKVLFKDFTKSTPSTKIFETLSALNALYRPGPMDSIPKYVENLESGEYEVFHPMVKDILKPTHGILVYQEQVMNMGELFGFSKVDKDFLRAAVAKKDEEKMAKARPMFVNGAVERGIDEELVSDYWDNLIVPFGNYAFNKSHADCYANIALKALVLKAYYPATYYAAALNFAGDSEEIAATLAEARLVGIKIESPKLSKCYAEAVADEDNKTIYIALKMVKNVSGAAESIAEVANKSENFLDFYINSLGTSINSRVFNNLITIGFFDEEKADDMDKLEFRQSLLFHAKVLLSNKDAKSISKATAAINTPLENEGIDEFQVVKYKFLKKDAKALGIEFDEVEDYAVQFTLDDSFELEMIEDYGIKIGLSRIELNDSIKELLVRLGKVSTKQFIQEALDSSVKLTITMVKKLIWSELIGEKNDIYTAADLLDKVKAYHKAQKAVNELRDYVIDFSQKEELTLFEVRAFEYDCFGMYISFPVEATGILANMNYDKRNEGQQKALTIMSVENKLDSFNDNEAFQQLVLTDGIVEKRAKIKIRSNFITEDCLHKDNTMVNFNSGNFNGNEYITINYVN